MKKIYENNIIKRIIPSVILGLMLLFTILTLFVTKGNNNSLFLNLINSDSINLGNIILVVILALEGIVFLVGAVLTIIKSKHYFPFFVLGLITSIIALSVGLAFDIITIVHLVVLILVIILAIIGIAYYFVGRIKYGIGKKEEILENEANDLFADKKIIMKLRMINLLNIIELVVASLVFFVPIAIFNYESTETYVLIRGLFGSKELYEIIPCLVLILIYIYTTFKYFDILRSYKAKSKQFLEKSKKYSYFTFGIVIAFFVTGVIGANIISTTLKIEAVTTYSFVPFIIFLPFAIAHGILVGSVGYETENKKLTNQKTKWTIFVFVTVFSFITFLSLFLSIISISNSDDSLSSFISPEVKLTPWDLLKKQSNLQESYSFLSFFILAIVVISAVLYSLSITAIFSKSKEAKRICLASIFANYIFILIMGLFGKYYQISYFITKDKLLTFLETKYPMISSIIQIEDPKVTSQVFFLIFVDTAIAIFLLILKPFTKSDNELLGTIKLDSSNDPIKVDTGTNAVTDGVGKQINSKVYDFDACPSFTELDLENDKFIEEMNLKRAKLFENPSLPALTSFIVEYARESRLHLSYTAEGVASFIAGLGATKLTILQGMSGTGKTSLPKIFLEAIMGNCEIIEVESSWKDKNELVRKFEKLKLYKCSEFIKRLSEDI